MRNLILLAALTVLVSGCRSQSMTRAEYEADHPYAKKTWELPPSPERFGTTIQYIDHVPTIGFDGNNYQLVERIDTIVVDANGRIMFRERR